MINISLNDVKLELETSRDVFSPSYVDRGTMAMIKMVKFKNGDKVLDLGCGYGFVGIYAAEILKPKDVTLCDINREDVELTRYNAEHNGVEGVHIIQSDGLKEIDEDGFSKILSNPPYHEDFSVPKEFIEDGYRKLAIGGSMYMVTKRKEWYKNKLISVFGGVKITESDGYYVFRAVKKSNTRPAGNCKKGNRKMSRKLMKRQEKMHRVRLVNDTYKKAI